MSATERRDLHTGTAVWDAYASPYQVGSVLTRSRKADVVIVGAGITGALAAEATTALGLSTVILDRRRPAHGSTAASTALVQFEIDTPLIHLADQIGFDKASRAWRRSLGAVGDLAGLIASLGISCGFRPRQAIYLAGNVLDATGLTREAEVRQSIGLPSTYLDHAALLRSSGISREAALLSGGSADLNPVQLTHGLLRIAVARGAGLYVPVELAEVVPFKTCVGLATSDGIEIEAGTVVFATGYELAHGIPTKGHRRTSTWAFATAPQPDALRQAGETVIWEAADPYLYLRSTVDGRLVVGGEDESIEDETKRDAMIAGKVQSLQKKAQALLPWIDMRADYSWAGTFGESDTGLPTIGPVPAMPHCFAVLGYGGNGTTFSSLAARLLQSHLTGKPDPDADIFAFE